MQWYLYVPAFVNRNMPVEPLGRTPVSKVPSSAVALWPVGPLFVQTTLSPTLIVIDFGVNLKSLIVTEP